MFRTFNVWSGCLFYFDVMMLTVVLLLLGQIFGRGIFRERRRRGELFPLARLNDRISHTVNKLDWENGIRQGTVYTFTLRLYQG